jgi:hypothetical protein
MDQADEALSQTISTRQLRFKDPYQTPQPRLPQPFVKGNIIPIIAAKKIE